MEEQDREYIRNLLDMFEFQDVHSIETALLIYEFTDKEMEYVTDKEIDDVYDFVGSQDKVFSDYTKEKVKAFMDKEEVEEEIEK